MRESASPHIPPFSASEPAAPAVAQPSDPGAKQAIACLLGMPPTHPLAPLPPSAPQPACPPAAPRFLPHMPPLRSPPQPSCPSPLREVTTHCVPRLFFDVCPATPKEPAVATFRVVLWHIKAELVTVTPLRMHGRKVFVCSLAPQSLWLQSAARLGPLLESLILKLARGLARSSLEPTSRGQN